MLFVDTSSLFKFYYPEPGSEAVEARMVAADRVAIAELTRLEFVSVAARKTRVGELSKKEYTRLVSAFDEDCLTHAYTLVPLTSEVVEEARSLMDRLGLEQSLRTLDSLQLASAMKAGAELFLCHDDKLAVIAEQIGMSIVKP